MLRPYEYDLDPVYDGLHSYSKSFLDARENTNYIYRLPTGGEFKTSKEVTNFMQYEGFFHADFDGNQPYNPMIFFCDNPQYTGKDFFLGMETRFKDTLPIGLK